MGVGGIAAVAVGQICVREGTICCRSADAAEGTRLVSSNHPRTVLTLLPSLSTSRRNTNSSTITPDAAPVAASASEGAETEGADEYLRLVEADVKVEAKH